MGKAAEKIRNWSAYNKALVERGSLNIWIEKETLAGWYAKRAYGKNGRPFRYADAAIECALVIKACYKLPLRALEGLLESWLQQLHPSLHAPSYSQISRRANRLHATIQRFTNSRPTDIVIDSTGLKVYGEGEWKRHKHGKGKRSVWLKAHLAVDPATNLIIVAGISSLKNGGDGQIGEKMLRKIPKSVKRVLGDGGYDGSRFRKAVSRLGAKPIIPPPKNARINKKSSTTTTLARNKAIRQIERLGKEGLKKWKKKLDITNAL